MPVSVVCQPINNQYTGVTGYHYRLQVYGFFEFSDHSQWHTILNNMAPTTQSIDIDFAALEYMDSSALGLLLQLRDKIMGQFCDELRPTIKLVKVNKAALKLLQRSGLHQLFDLEV